MTCGKRPTLTDAKGMGAITSLDGYDYQVWDALIRLPAWLRNPRFEGMAIEALEDSEARFFAPHAPRGHLLDRFQAKSGTLTRSELVDVFSSFRNFETAYPQAARVQTLVTPALPATLTWIARDPSRVRRARPFYRPFADIRAANDDKLHCDLVAEFGQDLGGFVADGIEVALRTLPDRASAEVAFGAALQEAFPNVDVIVRKLKEAFSALNALIAESRGVMLTRDRLSEVLKDALASELVPDRRLPLHVRSDWNGEMPDALELDASGFSGGAAGFPELSRWHAELSVPLDATARWARSRDYQRIALSGSYRLSVAFVVGWAFRSATGFELDIATRSGTWATDDHPASRATPPPWSIAGPQGLSNNRLVVGIGVLRDPVPDIRQDLGLPDDSLILAALLPRSLTNSKEVQVSVGVVKAAVAQAAARLRPTGIDLYYVGPVAFAVALGHRWNALPSTQLHEFLTSEGRYIPTAVMG